MKKQLLFLIGFGISGASSFAQSLVQLDPDFMGTNPTHFVSPLQGEYHKKTSISAWYCFLEAADVNQGGALNFTVFDNNTLFPDSLVQQAYGDSSSGYDLGRVNLHQIGQVFDPNTFYYSPHIGPRFLIDSISIAYRYHHAVPGSVDTLKFQLYENVAIQTGHILIDNVQEPSAWINYDRVNDEGAGASQEWTILLDKNDTAWAGYKVKNLALPDIAHTNDGGLFAVTYRFIPGYSYTNGDTIDHTWNDPAPTKELNHFQPLIGIDNFKSQEYSYNHALSLLSYSKYASDTSQPWTNSFIPGDVWPTFTEYAYIGFHVISYVGLDPISRGSIQVFPNPSMGERVTITLITTVTSDVTVELYDLPGNKVKTVLQGIMEAGEQRIDMNTTSLTSGIYSYRIVAGEQMLSGKLSIIK